MPEASEGSGPALTEIRNVEHSIGSTVESIKSPGERNLCKASALFVGAEAVDLRGYTVDGSLTGEFDEQLLQARVEQAVLPDGSRPTLEMVKDWFEAKRELASALLDGKVDVARPITQQNKEEAAYFKALNLTRERENNPAAREPHITDPEENRRLFEEATGELEKAKVKDLTFITEHWEDLLREWAYQLSEVQQGKPLQDLNDFLKEQLGTKAGEGAPPGVAAPPSEEGAEEMPVAPPPAEERPEEFAAPPSAEGVPPSGETPGGVPPVEQRQEEAVVVEKEVAPPSGEKTRPQETRREIFFNRVRDFFQNWWRTVSPQGRSKFYWGLGVGVGAAETLFIRTSLTPILGPVSSFAVSGVNALVLNGLNYRIQQGITEARANQDLERLQGLERRYKNTADFFAGVAAGSIGAAVGDALWNGLIAPRLPGELPRVSWPTPGPEGPQPMPQGIITEAGAAPPPTPTPEAVMVSTPTPTPGAEGVLPPTEAPQPTVVTPPAEVTPPTEVVPSVEVAPPVEGGGYVVQSGDTLSEILQRHGYEPYGKDLTELIVKNADILKERALSDAQRAAIDQLVANPDWIATDDNEKWRIIMRAGHWIFPGQELILP